MGAKEIREAAENQRTDIAAVAAAIKDAPYLDLTALKVYLTGTGRISTSSIYVMMREGALPKPIKIGMRRVAWVKQDVDAYLMRAKKGA